MGSGKTSVGKQLAKVMQLPFVDMDELIVQKVRYGNYRDL